MVACERGTRASHPSTSLGTNGARLVVLAFVLLAGCATTRPLEGATADGLRWKLWRDPAAKQRLAIWMHPSGESGEALIAPLAPLLKKYGYALLVPMPKVYAGWSTDEATAVFNQLVPTLDADPTLPLLIGFSAGGQMALLLWEKKPDAFGGVVLIGAAPNVEPPAKSDQTPVLALAGENEPIVEDWLHQVEPWRKAGVPLTFKVVPGRGHTFLLTPDQLPLFEQWLQVVVESSTTPPPGG